MEQFTLSILVLCSDFLCQGPLFCPNFQTQNNYDLQLLVWFLSFRFSEYLSYPLPIKNDLMWIEDVRGQLHLRPLNLREFAQHLLYIKSEPILILFYDSYTLTRPEQSHNHYFYLWVIFGNIFKNILFRLPFSKTIKVVFDWRKKWGRLAFKKNI